MIITSFVLGIHLALQSAAFQLSIPTLAKAPTADTILAKVNGVEVRGKDVEDLLWDVRGEEILNDILYYQIAKMEAEKLGIVVTNEEVDQQVARQMDVAKRDLPQGQTLEVALAQAGQTPRRLYLLAKSSLYISKIAMHDFDPKGYVRISTIIVHPRSESVEDITATTLVLKKAKDRLAAGEPWERLVNELVVDQEGKRQNGFLGWREMSAFPDDAKVQLTALKKGAITDPIKTKHGIQIFRIEAKGDGATKEELEQMRVELSETLTGLATQKIRKTLKLERLYPPKKSGS